ncbi:GDSL esterase/lipase At5g03600-like [Lolium perenne]|uniref:GDSL esterase/lipase At5g03600-like n=1 Tax=Lolium perenne TaxID=4522 RepID=UPI0021F65241|nr:GDSL esterase/lipase At5g03600-like [Lolium perenne]
MKMQALLSAVWGVGLLLVLCGARMGSARHNSHAPRTLYAFGDSFVDTGNLQRSPELGATTRQWYFPYGVSNDQATTDEEKATGRFSDYLVQSDFIAKMMGLPLSPPPWQNTHGQTCGPTGMNFAFSTSGVFGISFWITLREQVDFFKTMIKSRIISKNHVTHSVALLASSGNDYKQFRFITNTWQVTDLAWNITTEIATNVERLQNLGVKKILVNNLHLLGCTPSFCRKHNYKACDEWANEAASKHNYFLEHKLGNKKGVLIVDLSSAFDHIIGHGNQDLAQGKQFKHIRKPCCESADHKGYCGQQDKNSNPLYSLCEDPRQYFFWDDAHPTHAGWEAVMAQLQNPIKEFLGVA